MLTAARERDRAVRADDVGVSVLGRPAPRGGYPGRAAGRAAARALWWFSGEVGDALRGTSTDPQGGAPRGSARSAFLVAAVAAAVAGGTARVLVGSPGGGILLVLLFAVAVVTVLVAGFVFVAEPRSWTPVGAERHVGGHRRGSGPSVDC